MAHRPVVLCVLDGFGERAASEGNPIHQAETPTLDRLVAENPHTTLAASGAAIGMPDGAVGRGDLGYATLGAGRVLPTLASEVKALIDDDKLGRNPVIDQCFDIATYDKRPLHLVGLVSDGDNHAHLDHLFALLELADIHEVEVQLHAIVDGRDSAPRSCMDALDKVEVYLANGKGKIATISGRYWAMDRDQRWDRVYKCFHAMVRDKALGQEAPRADDVFEAISSAYMQDYDDAMIPPTRIGDYKGMAGDFVCDFSTPEAPWEWLGEDVGMAFNLRGDRMHHLVAMLTRQDLPEDVAQDMLMDRRYPVRAFREHCFSTLGDCGGGLDLPVAFTRPPVTDGFTATLAQAGLKQLRCGESERRHHVGRHFRGAAEPLDGEELTIVQTPAYLDEYDEEPALASARVAESARAALEAGAHDFLLVTLPNADLLMHDGDLNANRAAVEAVDRALGIIVAATEEAGGICVVTSSHAGAEQHEDEGGNRSPAHSAHPVPFIVAGGEVKALRAGGALADVAPTLLALLGLEAPAAMTGRSLVAE